MAALDQLAEIQALRNAMNELTDQQIADKLGDERTIIMNHLDVIGTQKLIWGAAATMTTFIILSMAAFIFCFGEKSSAGKRVVDGLYGTITLTTGYGDLVPKTTLVKFVACLLMLMGAYVLSLSNKAVGEVLARAFRLHPHRRLSCAVATMVMLIFVGASAAFLFDRQTVVTYPNSVYFAVTSLTGVGCGDLALEGNARRIFVSFWLIASSLLFQRALECVIESSAGCLVRIALVYSQSIWQGCVYFGKKIQNLSQQVQHGCGVVFGRCYHAITWRDDGIAQFLCDELNFL